MRETVLLPPFDRLWSGENPFAAVAALAREAKPEQIRRDVEGRRTLRFELEGQAYYLKWQNGVGWGRIAEELLRFRPPVLGAGNEWRAIRACHAAGVPTMHALAYGEQGRLWANRKSFLVTRAIEPAVDLDTYTRTWRDNSPQTRWKRALIREVANIASAMHTNGLNHRDFYICHFLLRSDDTSDADKPSLTIIDLHRMQIRNATPLRWRNKDLAALSFSTLGIGLSKRDKLRFLRDYFAKPLRKVLRDEAATLVYLERESIRLAARFERKFAHRPALQR